MLYSRALEVPHMLSNWSFGQKPNKMCLFSNSWTLEIYRYKYTHVYVYVNDLFHKYTYLQYSVIHAWYICIWACGVTYAYTHMYSLKWVKEKAVMGIAISNHSLLKATVDRLQFKNCWIKLDLIGQKPLLVEKSKCNQCYKFNRLSKWVQ